MFDNRDRSKAVFSPFASEEVSPPFSPHWEAKRRAAEALRALTETLVTSDADTEGLNALAQRLERESAALGAQPRLYGLEAFIADGKHDQFLGMAQLAGNNPGMTGTLTVRYHRPTPLNTDLSLRATLQGSTGRKTVVTGEMLMAGEVTASCEGLFIRPQKALLSTP